MAKDTPRRKKLGKFRRIDDIRSYTQRPRSPAPKRRTDFSAFFGSSSPSNSGSSLGSSDGVHKLSCVTMTSLDDSKDDGKRLTELPLSRCNESQDKKAECLSNLSRVRVMEFESVPQSTLTDTCNNRSNSSSRPNSDTSSLLEFNPSNSQTTNTNDSRIFPGNEALKRVECLRSCRQLLDNPEESKHSDHQEQCAENCTQSASSRSCRTKADVLENGRSRRQPKPKIHFDEVTFPSKSSRKVRRFKIMRQLGLIAPLGSPF